jgi:hypothetical protein
MKKLIIAAALILTTGILQSSTKQITVKPTVTVTEPGLSTLKKDIGFAD